MKIQIPSQYQFLFKPKRYKVMFSGRAAGKSWSIAQALLLLGVQKKLRILCTREFQNSITDSVHKLLCDINTKYSLGYIITQNSIYNPINGTEFMFYGLRSNITKIKSLEAVDICWIEEAETISENSLKILIPTIRKEGSEIWVSFNPFNETDSVYIKFVLPYVKELAMNSKYEDDIYYILKTNYDENPFLPSTIKLEIDALKESNYRQFQHVYLGLPVADHKDIIISPEWFDTAIDAHITLNFKARGVRVAGFDPADEGHDKKGLAIRHGSVITKLDLWSTGTLEEAVTRVYDTALDLHIQEIVYDSIGVGAGAKIKFTQLDPHNQFIITPFVGSHKPDDYDENYASGDMTNNDMFRNKRAQYYWLLKDRFEKTFRAIKYNEYCDPDELISISSECENINVLKVELTGIQRKRSNTTSMIQIESKSDMSKRGIKSPNIADALMYAFADNGINTFVTTPKIVYASGW